MLVHPKASQQANVMDATTKQMKVGENYNPIFSCQWTRVHEIWGQCRGPFVVSDAVSRLSISCSSPETLAHKKLPLSCEVIEDGWFFGRQYPKNLSSP